MSLSDGGPERSRSIPPTFFGRMRFGLFVFALASMAWGGYRYLTHPDCDIQTYLDSTSPDHEKRAVFFARSCITIEPTSHEKKRSNDCTNVSVLPAYGALPDEEGNAFSVDCSKEPEPGSAVGNPPVRVRWLGDRRMSVVYDARLTVAHHATPVNGVEIEFRPVDGSGR
jgi:hypothetical protein